MRPIPDSDAVVRAVHRLEFCEDGVTVMLPVRRCELIDGKMIAFLDAGDLEAYLLGYGEGVPLALKTAATAAQEGTP